MNIGPHRLRFLAAVASLAVVAGITAFTSPASAWAPAVRGLDHRVLTPAAVEPSAAQRALILVVPGLAWRDFDDNRLPNLRRFTDRAAIANLSSRAPKLRSDLASGYVTLGAGNKAVGVGPTADPSGLQPDGAGFGVDEPVGRDQAGEVFTRRTGRRAGEGLVHLGIGQTVAANRDSTFGAEVGALGDALAAEGFRRAVIANGDGSDVETRDNEASRRHRDAVAGLMGKNGTVPAGHVSNDLLLADPSAPFGVRLDPKRVEASFTEQWRDRAVVLVEASDLVRAEAYQQVTTPERGAAVRHEALRAADALLGRLLDRVDLDRDAVVLLGTAPNRTNAALAVAAVRAPGMSPGLLRSGTTQRAGFVQLMDIAPSVLDLLGLEPPESMRGRPIQVADTGGTALSRRTFLVDVDAAARFRAEIGNPVAATFIGLQCLLIAAALCATTGFARRVGEVSAPLLSSAALAYVPAVYLARLVPLHDLGLPAYWGFLMLVTIALAGLARVLARGRSIDTVIFGLGLIVAVLVADGVSGSHLQLNSALGFSAEAAGRFIGYGNAGYALLAAAALLLAGLVTHRLRGSPPAGQDGRDRRAAGGGFRGRLGPRPAAWVGVGVLAIALIADGAPFWGADVGGVLSMVPAYGVAAALLLGWKVRFRIRTVAVIGSATVIAVALAAVADLQRAAGDRSHLGRLVEQVRGEGFGAFTSVVSRKLDMNLASLSSSIWRILVPVAIAFIAYLAFAGSRPLVGLVRRIPELGQVLIGFAILLVLGYALNDTGILVPAVMLGVLTPVLVALIIPAEVPEREATPVSVEVPHA